MLRTITTAAFLATAVAATPAAAFDQGDLNTRYVIAVVTAVKINTYCPQYAVSPEAIKADNSGAEISQLDQAMAAAFSGYRQASTRPDVTSAMVGMGMAHDAEHAANPAGWCSRFGELFVQLGLAGRR